MKKGHFQCRLESVSRRKYWAKKRESAGIASGELIHDPHSGIMKDYIHQLGAFPLTVLLPEGAPETMRESGVFWGTAEPAEKRVNSCVARHLALGLPHEVGSKDRLSCAIDMGHYLVGRFRVGVDIYYSVPSIKHGGDPRNFRAHLLFTTREITPDGMGLKTRALDRKGQGGAELMRILSTWESIENSMYERCGIDVRVDCRSRKAQEIEKKAENDGAKR